MSLDLVAGLWQADYRETLQHVANMGGADLIFTSPPYCDARTYGNNVNWTLEDYALLGDAVFAALKPGGQCLLNLDAPVREWRKGFGSERGFHPWEVMLDWAKRIGFRVPDRLAYGRMGVCGAYSGRFRNDWEPLLWFQKLGRDAYFNKKSIENMATYPLKGGVTIAKSRKINGDFYSRNVTAFDTIQRGTLWSYGQTGHCHDGINPCEHEGHPARFSLRLASDVVRVFCPPGGLACDPFLGSGTTMIAALDYDRRFAGGDLFVRVDDGKPWIDIARDIARERYAQGVLL